MYDIGNRNTALFQDGVALMKCGWTEGQVLEKLRDTNATKCVVPLSEEELRVIVKGVFRCTK